MALTSRIGFTLFDRWGENLGRLPYTAATHTEALDGTDELKITCERELSKGQRIVWIDRQGMAHEHLVDEVTQIHDDDGKTYCGAVCINSIAELLDDYIEDKRPSGGVAEALTSILGGTRWEVGTCDLKASASHTFYHTSVREGLTDLIATWGGELETHIETDGVKVTHRFVGVRASRGDQDSPKRFTWTKDIVDIKRTVGSANPKTRVYGYGKGVETDTGGYGRRLTFGDVNGGKDYVEDAEATKIWGHPDGKGGILPAVDTYVNEQCEDAAQLLKETQDYLETVKEPTVSYEANVLDLYAYGRSWEGVALGDCVAIIDKQFAESGIRLKGRVSQIERDLVTADTTVTFGNLTDALTDMWETVAGALKSGAASRANYDAVANPSVGWLTLLQSALNKQFNTVGTYKVESFELGQIFSNVALNPETGTPVKTTANMWAVNINGMGIRLASSLAANGEWAWTTFITGQSVNADCINVGTMHADRVRAGLLTDEKGKNFWNLDTGEFQLSPGDVNYGTGGWTLDGVVNDIDKRVSDNDKDIDSLGNEFADKAKELDETLGTLDKTVDDLAKDGVVTEAEKAAVSKVMQAIGKERTDALTDYNAIYNHVALSQSTASSGSVTTVAGLPRNRLTTAFAQAYGSPSATTVTSGAYYTLSNAIDAVCKCTTASDLATAMNTYKKAYSDFVTKATAYLKVSDECHSLIEQYKAAKATDEMLTQTEVFNRLTNNGAKKGIYMTNGELYVNATYLKSGTISDGQNKNYWNLVSGYFQTRYGVIGGLSIDNNKLYRYKLTLDSNTAGLYIGTDGFSVGGGTCYTAMANGYLYGGTAEDVTGYVGFNNYNTSSKVYGARLAGKGCICLLTDDWIGVGPYKDRGEYVSCKTGQTGSVTLVGNLQSSWTRLSLTGTYNVSEICQNLSMSWTNWTLNFDHGLMCTSL